MAHFIELPTHRDDRGILTVIDKLLPFEIKRVFFIYDVSAPRGGHRHHVCQMALVAFSGAVKVNCYNGKKKESFLLDRPSKALVVDPADWHTMEFSTGSVLLIMASQHYDKNDYIFEAYE